jgi:hypothetical protein
MIRINQRISCQTPSRVFWPSYRVASNVLADSLASRGGSTCVQPHGGSVTHLHSNTMSHARLWETLCSTRITVLKKSLAIKTRQSDTKPPWHDAHTTLQSRHFPCLEVSRAMGSTYHTNTAAAKTRCYTFLCHLERSSVRLLPGVDGTVLQDRPSVYSFYNKCRALASRERR